MTKHISCTYECKFETRKWNSIQKWNNDKFRCECKNPKEHFMCVKDYVWNPATGTCKNVTSFINDSVISCDEFTDKVAKTATGKTTSTRST